MEVSASGSTATTTARQLTGPRLIGAHAALGMIVSGDPISAKKAEALGLVDRVVGEDRLAEEAMTFAREIVSQGPRRTGERAISAAPAVFEHFVVDMGRKIQGLDAPAACIEAIKAATEVPLADGLALERALFAKLLDGVQSKALRHLFFAERAAGKIDGVPKDTALRPIARGSFR